MILDWFEKDAVAQIPSPDVPVSSEVETDTGPGRGGVPVYFRTADTADVLRPPTSYIVYYPRSRKR